MIRSRAAAGVFLATPMGRPVPARSLAACAGALRPGRAHSRPPGRGMRVAMRAAVAARRHDGLPPSPYPRRIRR